MSILDHAIQIDNAAYHASPRLSWSKFKRFLQSPKVFRHTMENPINQTPAMAFGSLCHCLVFEPKLFDRDYHVFEKLDGRTAAGKEQKAALEADPREAVTVEDYQRAEAVAIECRALLPRGWGVAEAAFYADIGGVYLQCKCDLITDDGQVYDLKTCASLENWLRGMEGGDWMLGDVWYRMTIEAATGIKPPPVLYIGVETSAPFDSAVRHYPDDYYELGKMYLRGKLAEYRACLESGIWPGVDGAERGAKEIELKPWALTKLQAAVLDSDEFRDAEPTEAGL